MPDKPLKYLEILERRSRAGLVSSTAADECGSERSAEEQSRPKRERPSPGPPSPPAKRHKSVRGRELWASLTDPGKGQMDNRTSTANTGHRPFTVVLWNVENYGENKAAGNPFANRIIRYVLDELNVDVAIFLETQAVPTEVVIGLEHRVIAEMRTSKQKKQAPKTDITVKKRFTSAETHAMQAEEDTRQAALEVLAAGEDEEQDLYDAMADEIVEDVKSLVDAVCGDGPTFHAIASITTGKQKALPDRVGPYRKWDRDATRDDKRQDISRFKKLYSYEGGQVRPTPNWLLWHYNDLADVYDLRLRVEADHDEEELSRPLTRDEIVRLRRAVRRMCFAEEDLEDWTRIESRRRGLTVEAIDQKVARLQANGVDIDREKVINLLGEDPALEEREGLLPKDREAKKDIRGLLLDLEKGAVLTLRPDAAKSEEQDKKLPPRDLIGWLNEGNSCYLNACLHLLWAIPINAREGRDPAVRAVRKDVEELLGAAQDQAQGGGYSTRTRVHPDRQEGPEDNWVRYYRTRGLREKLAAVCGWHSIYGQEDASEALVRILEAYAPAGPPSEGDMTSNWDARTLDAIRPTPLHFFFQTYTVLPADDDWTRAEGDATPAVPYGQNRLAHRRTDVANMLELKVPKGEKTFAQALTEYRAPPVPADDVRFSWEGQPYTAHATDVVVELEAQLPDHLLVRIERLVPMTVHDPEPADTAMDTGEGEDATPRGKDGGAKDRGGKGTSGAGGGVRLVRWKDGTAVTMPEVLEIGEHRWSLRAFLIHHGLQADSGHYTAYVRKNDVWYHLDDERVTPNAPIEGALKEGYIYYYGPEGGDEPAHEQEDEGASNPSQASLPPSAQEEDSGSGGEADDLPIEKICPWVADLLDMEPDARLVHGALPDPKPVDQNRLRQTQDLLTDMIGVRNVETYTVLFRQRPDEPDARDETAPPQTGASTSGQMDTTAGTSPVAELDGSKSVVHRPIWSFGHANVGHYAFKEELLSQGVDGEELGYQDSTKWINGRCPFYFELDVWKGASTVSTRLPFVVLHAPYGLPAAFRTEEPKQAKKPAGVDGSADLPHKAKPMTFDGADKDAAIRMRADAMRNLLDLGIPRYDGSIGATALRDFADGIIAGDFNLDMTARGEDRVIGGAYGALEGAQFVPIVDEVRTTLAPVETILPARDDENPSPEDEWYGSAYDNIFLKSGELQPVMVDGKPVGGAIDVFDFINRLQASGDDPKLFDQAYEVIKNPANYHKATHSPRTRAEHETARWKRNLDDRARAYFLYRRYVSDHLPVFVDLDLHSDVFVRSQRQEQGDVAKVPRAVIGITNHGATCYLNTVLQLLAQAAQAGPPERPAEAWSTNGARDHEELFQLVNAFLTEMAAEARDATYEGNGDPFDRAGADRKSYTRQATHTIRNHLSRSGLVATRFDLNQHQDAAEVLDAILTGAARSHSGGDGLELSPNALATANAAGTLHQMLPGPLHFFLRKTTTFQLADGERHGDEGGIVLDADWQAMELECHNLLRIELPADRATLQQAWDQWGARTLALDWENGVHVQYNGKRRTGTRVNEALQLIEPLPNLLFVQLKRFAWEAVPAGSSGGTDVSPKPPGTTDATISKPPDKGPTASTTNGKGSGPELRQRKLSTEVDATDGLCFGNVQYDVIGIGRHLGAELSNGHFVAFVRVADGWYKLDDQSVVFDPPDRDAAMKDGYLYLLRRRELAALGEA